MKLILENKIKNEWIDVINHEVDYYLATINSLDQNCSLKFKSITDTETNSNCYVCELNAKSVNGKCINASARSTDGKLALRNALSRLRREIVRNSKLTKIQKNINRVSVQ